jgi:hypothetical protein
MRCRDPLQRRQRCLRIVLNLIDRMAKTPADQMKRIEKLISEGG